MGKQSFTCQTPGCLMRRTYQRDGNMILVDACEHCGEGPYAIEDVAS